ncbi:MAG: branched-chain alpha-keto acid dehydrogenase subunit E2 [Pseudonocardiales bacterium]|nr:2-oxo acid dehydrogenase subunit E2 [Actinomycetota bacterium]PZS18293.1 MAG: branched-chain alpha-keto acid dehydrogenase subunit E2 [Pseudonocardiales bacterium]
MTSIFALPDVGEGLTEAEILSWHVAPGDTVTVNQIIVDIETAKAAVELPSPYAGVVSELFAEPGATVAVGTPIIAIETGADTGAAPAGSIGPAPAGAIGEEGASGRIANLVGYGPRTATVARRPRKAAPSAGSAAPSPAPSPAAAPLAKPPVRKLAKELGVDLRTVLGSAAGGVITREDVERAAHVVDNGRAGSAARSSPGSGLEPSHGSGPESGPESGAGQRREPVRGVRKATAAAVVSSAFTAPHVTMFLTVDVTPMMELRARLKAQPQFRDVKLTPLAFAARAVCLAVRRTPDVNARWDEATGEIVYFDYVNLGIAAATPRGLVVPKIRNADRMALRELAVALDELAVSAREGRTPPADMLGGTITITNIGVFGIDTGTPILNPGESAILALGTIRDMPWVVDGVVTPRKVCQLALSVDHRVVDGQQGSQFLAHIGALLSDPAQALTY